MVDDLVEYYQSNFNDGYSRKYVEDKLVEKAVELLDVLGDRVIESNGNGEVKLTEEMKERL